MPPLLLGIALLCIAWLIHLTIWKIRLPKRQTKALLATFMLVLISASFFQSVLMLTFAEWLSVSIFYVGAMLAYTISYSALEADSPSLLIVRQAAEPGGVSQEEIYNKLNDSVIVTPRIYDLVRDGHIVLRSGKYFLTPKGRKFISIFAFYRNFLRAEPGG